ncbi:hypothetical protein [Tenacibaculum aquimarinum]|uniref:hypothetical protein n=1 Tax=Tenacibaculum aquimarinum TaxID=2910675 RepID=UPI001F0B50F0|nr:hypothetical protein [Tenacibaculum aquimarinum]MCH3885208.1 hypothetical protein [Tenacibaculum aquimarinum]
MYYYQQKQNIVDEEITLEFSSDKDVPFQLYCANSYGSTIIEPIISNQNIKFKIPRFLTKKRGAFSWKTINSEANIYGNITILPQQQPATIETYLGPPSIDAGESDYTMLVVIPTDSLDNPILDNSKVDVKHQFLKSEKKSLF